MEPAKTGVESTMQILRKDLNTNLDSMERSLFSKEKELEERERKVAVRERIVEEKEKALEAHADVAENVKEKELEDDIGLGENGAKPDSPIRSDSEEDMKEVQRKRSRKVLEMVGSSTRPQDSEAVPEKKLEDETGEKMESHRANPDSAVGLDSAKKMKGIKRKVLDSLFQASGTARNGQVQDKTNEKSELSEGKIKSTRAKDDSAIRCGFAKEMKRYQRKRSRKVLESTTKHQAAVQINEDNKLEDDVQEKNEGKIESPRAEEIMKENKLEDEVEEKSEGKIDSPRAKSGSAIQSDSASAQGSSTAEHQASGSATNVQGTMIQYENGLEFIMPISQSTNRQSVTVPTGFVKAFDMSGKKYVILSTENGIYRLHVKIYQRSRGAIIVQFGGCWKLLYRQNCLSVGMKCLFQLKEHTVNGDASGFSMDVSVVKS